jgi:hypothetical protein
MMSCVTTSQSGEESQVAISGAEIANPELARQAIREYLNDAVRNTCLPIEPRVEAIDLGLTPRQMEVAHIKPLEDGAGYYQEPWPVLIRGRLPTEQRVRVYKLKITSLIGDPSYAYMLVPMSQGPHPLAVVAHQTLATCGAREPLGACPSEEQGLPWQAHGMKLSGHGLGETRNFIVDVSFNSHDFICSTCAEPNMSLLLLSVPEDGLR